MITSHYMENNKRKLFGKERCIMVHPLLPHQLELLSSINSKLYNNRFIVVIGNSGCGKSYSFEYLHRAHENYGFDWTMLLDGDYYSGDRDYSPFKKALFSLQSTTSQHIKKGAVEAAKDIPFVGNFLSYVAKTVISKGNTTDINIFNDEEQVIINQIKRLASNKKCCFICDNIHWWDHRSLKLLLMLLKPDSVLTGSDFHKVNFILSITEDQDTPNKDLIKNLLSLVKDDARLSVPIFQYADFRKGLHTAAKHSLADSQIELLYNLMNGHLKIYYEILSEIKDNSFDFDMRYHSNIEYLSRVLNKRLAECGATGPQIAQVLEYASIIGMSFSSLELGIITDYTKSRLMKIINDANEMKLTETAHERNYYRFAHDIIREIFRAKVNAEYPDHYETLALCLKEIKPGQYLRRAKYMMSSLNAEKAAILYCLDMISQLRIYQNISEDVKTEVEHILSSRLEKYVDHMDIAYKLFHSQKFSSALDQLDLILDYYPIELLAERDILRLRCYSKKLATNTLEDTINKFDKKRVALYACGEKEIYERMGHALITAFAHLGNIKRAREIEEEILNSISSRVEFDDSAETRVNVIKRNANAIHGIEISPILVEQAVHFFGQTDENDNIRDIRQYYTSSINYSAVLTMQGRFSIAYREAMRALELENDNEHITFPRPQILRSNLILSGVLDKKISPATAIDFYTDLLSSLPGVMAEKLFYCSNLSILYSILNRPNDALDILHNESLNHEIAHDVEGLYRYHVTTNCAIYKYLLGDRVNAIHALEEQSLILTRMINGSYFCQRNTTLIDIMNAQPSLDGYNWINAVRNKCPSFQGAPWRYFGLGYAFISLCDWGV